MRPVLPRAETAQDFDQADRLRAQTANLYNALQSASRQIDRIRPLPTELRQQIGGHMVLEDLLSFASACLATETSGPKATAVLLANQADTVVTQAEFDRVAEDVAALDRVYRSVPLVALAARIPFLAAPDDRRRAAHTILTACWKLAPQPCSLVLAAIVPALFHGPADSENSGLFTRLGNTLPPVYHRRPADALAAMRLHTEAEAHSAALRDLPDKKRSIEYEDRLRRIAVLPSAHRFEALACVAADRGLLPDAALPDLLPLLFGAAQALPHPHYLLLLQELCRIDLLPVGHMLLNLDVLLHATIQLHEDDAIPVLDRLIDLLPNVPDPERRGAVTAVRAAALRCLPPETEAAD